MRVEIASVDSVIIYLGDCISDEISKNVKGFYRHLISLKNFSLIEIIPSYTSILIKYDIFKFDYKTIQTFLTEEYRKIKFDIDIKSEILEVDVYYSCEVGLDLERVSKSSNLTIDEIINIHSSKIYDVYSIGFLPGFAYLANVDSKIQIPRLKTPRKKIPKGSVAIADNQTAVYPCDSPGGWNIIGKTTFEFFDRKLATLSPININSKIKFNPISKEKYLSQGGII